MTDSRKLYFVNFPTDFLFIGGASLLMFFWIALVVPDMPVTAILPAALFLQYAINYPHFSATIYRFYRSPGNIRQYPMTGLVWPVIVFLAFWAGLQSPALFAPYFITLYLIWSPYHFSGQTTGLTMLYARRSGFYIGKKERFALSAFTFGTFFVLYSRAGVKARLITDPAVSSSNSGEYLGIPFIDFPMPEWAYWISLAVMCAGGVSFLTMTLKWAIRNKHLPPLILYTPALAQLFWFVVGYETNLICFYLFVSTFHGLQYLYITWAVQLKEAHGDRKVRLRDVMMTTSLWSVMNLAGGMAMFVLLPMGAIQLFGTPPALTMALVFAALQVHHFFVDGVIWKLRNKNVLDGLTVNVPQWIRET